MSAPRLEDVPRMTTPQLLAAVNDCQNAFDDGDGADADHAVRLLLTSSAIHRELRRRGMTELAIESFIRNVPNWRAR